MARHDAARSPELTRKIIALRERFESDWKAGRPPRVETFLSAVIESEQAVLLRELLPIDFRWRKRAGDRPGAEEYICRFPRFERVIRDLRLEGPRETGKRPARSRETAKADRPESSTASETPVGPQIMGDLPEKFGRYRIIRKVGEGAMGTVYQAHDEQLDRDVALKVPRISAQHEQEMLDRFFREARAAATIHHQHLCPVYDVGEIDGKPFLTMAFIEGTLLSQFIQGLSIENPISQSQAAQLVRTLALALGVAHRKGVVHRDMKPANIMLDESGEPVIMDFGLARREQGGDPRITQSGSLVGSPSYMSPEQALAKTSEIGPATDIYSLGVILYELLTGQLPFQGPLAEVLAQITRDEPPPLAKHRADVDPRLTAICLKSMAKKVPDRFATMSDFANALTDYLVDVDAPRSARFLPPGTALAAFRKRRHAAHGSGLAARVIQWLWPNSRRAALVAWMTLGLIVLTLSAVLIISSPARHSTEKPLGRFIESGPVARILDEPKSQAEETVNPTVSPQTPLSQANGPRPGEGRSDNSLNLKLVWCPPGTFVMGSPDTDPDRFRNEAPVAVELTQGFWLGEFEVTQDEWQRLMGTAPWTGKGFVSEQANFPATFINWEDAVTFCDRLTAEERTAGRLPTDSTYALPTEAQWEYACRAGTKSRFSFGESDSGLEECAWIDKNAYLVQEMYAHAVGQKRANPWGLHDMHGNVWEWCRDWYAERLPGGRDPQVTSPKSFRVSRGGSWVFGPAHCRSANRGGHAPTHRHFSVGFRVALIQSVT